MAYARTQKGAMERVRMKHAIRKAGLEIASNATTTEIRRKYRMTRRRKGHKIGEVWTALRRIRGRVRTVRVKRTGRHREKVRVEKGLKYQSKFLGRTKRAIAQDRELHAKPPGRRRAEKSKKIYFEHRANRSDIGKI